jgi:hypothetical protein
MVGHEDLLWESMMNSEFNNSWLLANAIKYLQVQWAFFETSDLMEVKYKLRVMQFDIVVFSEGKVESRWRQYGSES